MSGITQRLEHSIEIIRIHVSGLRFDKSVGIREAARFPKRNLFLIVATTSIPTAGRSQTLLFSPDSWTTPTWRTRRGAIVNYRLLRLTRNSCHEFQLPSFSRSLSSLPCIALFLVTCSSNVAVQTAQSYRYSDSRDKPLEKRRKTRRTVILEIMGGRVCSRARSLIPRLVPARQTKRVVFLPTDLKYASRCPIARYSLTLINPELF